MLCRRDRAGETLHRLVRKLLPIREGLRVKNTTSVRLARLDAKVLLSTSNGQRIVVRVGNVLNVEDRYKVQSSESDAFGVISA